MGVLHILPGFLAANIHKQRPYRISRICTQAAARFPSDTVALGTEPYLPGTDRELLVPGCTRV